MKGAIAAILLAVAEAPELRGDLIVTAVADEELGSIGTQAVLERVTADAAIVVEPTELQLAVAHRGFLLFEIETAGVAAHGSRPELGVDAIARMGPVLVALEGLDRRLQAGDRHPLVGPGLAARLADRRRPGVLELSVAVPAHRRAAHDSGRDARADRAGAARRCGRCARCGSASAGSRSRRRPDRSAELVARIAGVTEPVGVPFWTDAALVADAGIPTVLFGPVGSGAHADVEWVDLASLERLREVVLRTAVEWCD